MPQVVAAIPLAAGAIGGIGAAAGGISLTSALIAGGLSLAMGTIASFLGAPDKKVSPGRNPFGAQPDEYRKWCYGRGATGSSIEFWETNGDNNRYLWIVGVVQDTQADGFEAFYVNNVRVDFDAVTGAATPSNIVLTNCHVTNGSAVVTVASTVGLQAGQSVIGTHLQSNTKVYSVDSATSFRLSKTATGSNTTETITAKQVTLYCDSDGGNPKMWRWDHLGTTGQAADAQLVAASAGTGGSGLWTSKCRLQGMAYFVWKMQYDTDKYPTGTPTPLIVFRGRHVWDPREDVFYGGVGSQTRSNEATWSWSQNAALCLLDYLLGVNLNGVRIGGCGIPISALDIDSFIAAANVCDEAVALKGGGTEARYTVNGFVDAGEDKQAVIQSMLQAMAGMLVYRGGLIALIPGAAQTSIISLDDSDLGGPVKLQSAVSRQDKSNTITSVYSDPHQLYANAASPVLSVPAYVLADGGVTLEKEVRHRFTTSLSTVQRLNKIILANEREQFSLDGAFKPRGSLVSVGDAFVYSCDPAGVVSQKMLCINRDRNTGSGDAGSARIIARQETDAKWAWAEGEEQDPPVFNINQVMNPADVAAPLLGDVAASASTIAGASSSTIPVIALTANQPPNPFVIEIITRWKLHSATDSAYSPGPTMKVTPGATSYAANIQSVAYGVSYDVGFAYRTALSTSAWTTVSDVGSPTQSIVTGQINQGAVTNTQAASATSPSNVGAWTPPAITTTNIGSGNKYRLTTVSGLGSDYQIELFLSGMYNSTSSDDYDVYFWFEYQKLDTTWADIPGNPFITRSHSLLDRPSFGPKVVITPSGLSSWSGTIAAFCYVSLHSIDLIHADLTVTELKR